MPVFNHYGKPSIESEAPRHRRHGLRGPPRLLERSSNGCENIAECERAWRTDALPRGDPSVPHVGAAGGVHARQELARAWRPRRGPQAHYFAFAARGAHRHGLSRLWAAHRRSGLRGQCRSDAGGEALRSRQGIQARHLCHVVDPGGDPGIHPALLEPREDGHDRGPEEALLQPAQDQRPVEGARGGRPPSRSGEAHRHPARRHGGGRGLHEPAAGRRLIAQRAGAQR